MAATQTEEEQRKRKDVPCSPLQSELLMEGMTLPGGIGERLGWKGMVIVAALGVAIAAGLWYMATHHGGHMKKGDSSASAMAEGTIYQDASPTGPP